MVSNRELKNILQRAIHEFYEKDSILVSVKGMEQACVFRIGLYLNQLMQNNNELSNLDIDCEYNKSNEGTKTLAGVKIRPDLIVHKRNLSNHAANPHNTLVVEFKGWWNNNTDDIDKLIKFTKQEYGYHYPLAVWVKLGKSKNKTQYKYFCNGQKVDENDL